MAASSIVSLFILIFIILIVGKAIYDIKFGIKDRQNHFIGELQLIYRQDEPFFNYFKWQYAKILEIRFDNERDFVSVKYILSLQKGHHGWDVQLEVSTNAPKNTGLVHPKNIKHLAKRINNALQRNQEYDLGAEIASWRVHEKTADDGCTANLIPSLENITPLPEYLSPKHLLLTYQNGQPIFFQSNQIGRRVVIVFGECWFDDHQRSVASFSIEMKFREAEWYVTLESTEIENHADWYATGGATDGEETYGRFSDAIRKRFLAQEVKAVELVGACNHAIRNGQSFDFLEYINNWEQWDRYFGASVVANTLYLD